MKLHLLALSVAFAVTSSNAPAQLLISEWLANPSGTDSPFEWVELVAASDIDFAVTPHSVVFTDNGTATANGWVEGGSVTYGFNITSGTVTRGDVVYVGGSGMAPTGTKLRVIDTGTTLGDGFGNFRTGGVLGNGSGSADGIAIFAADIAGVTSSLRPIDAVFFGSGTGGAVVDAGASGYELPMNDLYNGGKLQANSFVAPDPGGGDTVTAAGSFDPITGTWTVGRTFALGAMTDGASSVALVPVPEPSIWAMVGIGTLVGFCVLRRREA